MIGFDRGTEMLKKRRMPEAPSMAAASYRSLGIVASPAEK